MAVRAFSKKPHKKHCCPKPPCLRPNIVTTTLCGNAALQANTPAPGALVTTVTPGTTTPVTVVPPTILSATTFGAPVVFSVQDPSPTGLVFPVAGGTGFTGLRVSQVPFNARINAGVSIAATIAGTVATTP